MVSTSGCKLLRDDAIDALTSVLFPIADIITPNLHEAQILCGFDIRSESDMVRAADVIYNKYNVTVLLKGGIAINFFIPSIVLNAPSPPYSLCFITLIIIISKIDKCLSYSTVKAINFQCIQPSIYSLYFPVSALYIPVHLLFLL